MIGGAIFDVDGTLLDSMGMWDTAASGFLRTMGVEADAGLDRLMFTMTVPEGVAYARERYRLPQSEDELIAGLNDYVYHFYAEEVQPRPGMPALIAALRENGVPMAAATSSERAPVEAALARVGILPALRAVFTCTEVGAGKRSPAIYEAALEALGRPARETVWVFEDALYAARTAQAAGFRVCGLYDPSSAAEQDDLRVLADFYCRDADDLDRFVRAHLTHN